MRVTVDDLPLLRRDLLVVLERLLELGDLGFLDVRMVHACLF